ncbi:hypothetical protein Slin15195_G081810 [Septoria linicola]|uniref:Uncharacterized protein n=1 Tax=Septoria linicola TaxID=215465 RepID=A0A9Q9ASA1_9PEZI|nr:hypothetical protein Slin15195_G081810 [Septoria linicola]
MATPEIATSHTKRISCANYPTSTVDESTVEFYFRRGDVKKFGVVNLTDQHTARATIKSELDRLSSSPTRVILLNDDTKVDMPEVSLDRLEQLIKEETVIGHGEVKQIFVIVYDRDPTVEAIPPPEQAAQTSKPAAGGGIRGRGKRVMFGRPT